MSAVQLDLLDLLAELNGTPRASDAIVDPCPACGSTEDIGRRGALAQHAYDLYGRPNVGLATCTPMSLTRNHVLFDLRALARLRDHEEADCEQVTDRWLCAQHPLAGDPIAADRLEAMRAHHRADARRYYARAARVWRNHLGRLHAQFTPHLEAAGLTTTDLTKE